MLKKEKEKHEIIELNIWPKSLFPDNWEMS